MGENVYNPYAAKTPLSRLVDRAAQGEEIIIAKAGKPTARLSPVKKSPALRQPGGWEGKVFIAEDFDEPLPEEILAAFEGREE